MDEFESKKYIGDEVFFFMIIIYTYWNLNEMYNSSKNLSKNKY